MDGTPFDHRSLREDGLTELNKMFFAFGLVAHEHGFWQTDQELVVSGGIPHMIVKGFPRLSKLLWESEYVVPQKLMLISSELAEAMEAHRKGDRENFVEEMVDVFIRLGDMIDNFEMSDEFMTALQSKHEKNRRRPHKHGKGY